MKKIIYAFVAILALMLLAWYSPSRNPANSFLFSMPSYGHVDIQIGNEKFDAVVAETEQQKTQGLGGLKGLGEHQAMIFPYSKPAILPFWMKDMLFPIDILWLDTNLRVVYMKKGATPDSYPELFSPTALSQFVVEFSSGTLDRLNVREGDSVSLSVKK